MFIRFIVYSLILYFVMKAFRNVMRYFNRPDPERPEVKTQQRTKPIVEKKDIIEAEFEEIPDEKE